MKYLQHVLNETLRLYPVVPYNIRISLKDTTLPTGGCERSVGTVFQLPSPDAIYSRDERKERRWLPSLVVCVCARSTRC
jgi:hypothetical protein